MTIIRYATKIAFRVSEPSKYPKQGASKTLHHPQIPFFINIYKNTLTNDHPMFGQIHTLEQKKRQTTWVSETQLVPLNGSYQQPPKKDQKSSTVIYHPFTHTYQIQSSFFRNTKQGNV